MQTGADANIPLIYQLYPEYRFSFANRSWNKIYGYGTEPDYETRIPDGCFGTISSSEDDASASPFDSGDKPGVLSFSNIDDSKAFVDDGRPDHHRILACPLNDDGG
ncbi:MAG: hypothetical protein Q7S00_02460 [bacterium]|nr:hypothetical protein [bacterium]